MKVKFKQYWFYKFIDEDFGEDEENGGDEEGENFDDILENMGDGEDDMEEEF